jgi:two-component sensor histidine kinase
MVRYLLTVLSAFVCFSLPGQPQSGASAVIGYTMAQKQLLILSTAKFINILNENEVDRDSAILIACRITGVPFLIAYGDDPDSGADFAGSGLINSGRISEAIRLLAGLKGEQRLELTIQLAKWYLHRAGTLKTDLDNANRYIQSALSQSAAMRDSHWRYECLTLLAEFDRQEGNIRQSKKILRQIISSSQGDNHPGITADAWYQLGISNDTVDSLDLGYLSIALNIYRQLQRREKEIEVLWEFANYHKISDLVPLKRDLDNILEIQDSIRFRHSLFAEYMLAFSSLQQQKPDDIEALRYANAALQNMKWSGLVALQAPFNLRVGSVYLMFDKEKALPWFKKGLEGRTRETQLFWFKSFLYAVGLLYEMGRFEEALSLTLTITDEFPPITPWQQAQVLTTKGECYKGVKNYKLADKNFMAFLQLLCDNPGLSRHGEFGEDFYEIIDFYLANGNLKAARLFFGFMSSKNVNLGDRSGYAEILYQLDSAAGNYKSAFENYKIYQSKQDSFKSLEQREKFDELTVRYDADKKDKDIKLLRKDKELQGTKLLQANNTRNWTLGGVGLLLVIVGLLLYNSRLKQRTNRKLETQRLEIASQNNSLQHLLDEKDWLLKEIHHRVKNNLQIVISLLSTQSRYLDNEQAIAAISESRYRMQAMSLIHQKLYQSDNVAFVSMQNYVRDLVAYLNDSFGSEKPIHFGLDIDAIDLDVSQAIPVGLILNEAIVNSIKHAFTEQNSGAIEVRMKMPPDGQILLEIRDNGKGLPADFDLSANRSMGMRLIKGLVKQLKGKLITGSENGFWIGTIFQQDLSLKPAAL